MRTELVRTELVRTELESQVEIRQLKELEVFNALRLSVEVFTEVLLEVLADVAGRTELEARVEVQQLKARVEVQQPEELEVFNSLRLPIVLLMAVCY